MLRVLAHRYQETQGDLGVMYVLYVFRKCTFIVYQFYLGRVVKKIGVTLFLSTPCFLNCRIFF